MTGRRQLDRERWLRIEHVCHAARERDARARAQFLAEACAGDSELCREVESLLAQGEGTGSFLGTPAGSAEVAHFSFLHGLNMETSTMVLTSTREIPRSDEEPQTNAENAYVCATRCG